jgi:clan AA aspartic protease (TIGR02281 family)
MKKFFFIVPFLLFGLTGLPQTVIQMKKEGGVSIIPCKVNGLALSFIFDTGASDVTISLTEAQFMFKNGYLNKDDIIGTSRYSDANGFISEGININLKEIEIQGLKLFNVKASIVKKLDAPLLLGQSAISKLGKIEIDFQNNILTIKNNQSNNSKPNKSIEYCKDFDGNKYKVVEINGKIWMAENLNVYHYKNGDIIPQVTDPEKWDNLTTGAWCYYNNDPKMGKVYGKLYNWYAVIDPRGIAPEGWSVPKKEDFISLINFLGKKDAGKKMKEKSGWKLYDQGEKEYVDGNGNNICKFSGLPGGWMWGGNNFSMIYEIGVWWTCEISPYYFDLYNGKDDLDHMNCKMNCGFSIRCIKD